MINIFWSNDDQAYITIPDGSIATHQQIKEYFENRHDSSEVILYADGKTFCEINKHIPIID